MATAGGEGRELVEETLVDIHERLLQQTATNIVLLARTTATTTAAHCSLPGYM